MSAGDERPDVDRIMRVIGSLTELDGLREARAALYNQSPADLDQALVRLERCAGLVVGRMQVAEDAYRWRDRETGLWSREYVCDILPIEFQRATRYDYPLTCVAVAVDGSDEIREALGDAEAQRLLDDLAQGIGRSVRSCDLCCRFDDVTILALLPNTSLEGTVVLARRLREIARELTAAQGLARPATLSVGAYTLMSKNVASADELMRRARQALTEAQLRGGDNACARGGYRWDLAAEDEEIEWADPRR